MSKARVWFGIATMACVACTDSFGPGIVGRWAAPGIELVTRTDGGELRLPCVSPFELSRLARFDTTGAIQFAGAAREMWYNYDFVFRGQLHGDTLSATLTVTAPDHVPAVVEYLMTPGADSGLERVVCLV